MNLSKISMSHGPSTGNPMLYDTEGCYLGKLDGDDFAPGEADECAQLLIAAPKLLKACKAAVFLLRKLGGKNHDPEYSELLAAIRKAEGRVEE